MMGLSTYRNPWEVHAHLTSDLSHMPLDTAGANPVLSVRASPSASHHQHRVTSSQRHGEPPAPSSVVHYRANHHPDVAVAVIAAPVAASASDSAVHRPCSSRVSSPSQYRLHRQVDPCRRKSVMHPQFWPTLGPPAPCFDLGNPIVIPKNLALLGAQYVGYIRVGQEGELITYLDDMLVFRLVTPTQHQYLNFPATRSGSSLSVMRIVPIRARCYVSL